MFVRIVNNILQDVGRYIITILHCVGATLIIIFHHIVISCEYLRKYKGFVTEMSRIYYIQLRKYTSRPT